MTGLIAAILIALSGPPADEVAKYMRRMEKEGFSGAVLVRHGPEVLLRAGYGFANVELGVRNGPETIFRIGSVTKPLVAATVLRLVSRDLLSLEDPLSRFISKAPEEWAKVRIVDLLSHTSGIPDLFGDVASGPPDQLRRLVDEVLREPRVSALRSEPGSQYAYSNFNYLLLAYIIEVSDGSPWVDVLRREVLEPAGLRATVYDNVWELVPGRARGYERAGEDLRNTEYKDHGALSAGGFLSTLDDLDLFSSAVDGGRLLPEELEKRMVRPVHGNYALGWQVTRFFDRPVRNHTGGIAGFSAHMAAYPDDGVFIAVLSNIESSPVKAIACDLAGLTLETGETVLDRRPVDAPDGNRLDLMAGAYVGEDGRERLILHRGDSLTLESGESSYPLDPIGSRRFTTEAIPGVTLEFKGKPGLPATAVVARSCGSYMFTASRQGE